MKHIFQALMLCALVVGAHAQTITAIKVSGNQRIDNVAVLSKAGLEIGQELTPERLHDALRDLYASGYFADAKVTESGRVVCVEVVEHPIVNRIAFEGNSDIEDKVLTGVLSLKERRAYSVSALKADTKTIQDLYRLKGNFAAKVTPQIIRRDQNRVDVVFAITEGQATKIRKIIFVGNKAYRHAALEDVIQTKESRWYRFFTSDDNYDPDRLELDKEKLRRFYLQKGYAGFRVHSAVAELTPDQKEFFITFSLEEGVRHRVGKVSVVSHIANVDGEALASFVECQSGSWYDVRAVDKSIEKLTQVLGEQGVPFAQVRPQVSRADEADVLNVQFEIHEGPHLYINHIDIKGNHTTDDDVLRRELLLYEGDPYNAHRVQSSERMLRNLGLFKKVSVSRTETAVPDKVDLRVEVEEESSSGDLWVAGGAGNLDGLLGSIGYTEHNFRGRGQELSFVGTVSQKRQLGSIGFTEPHFLGRPLAFDVNLAHEDCLKSYNKTFRKKTTEGRVGFKYRLSENLRHAFRFGAAYKDLSELDQGQSPYLWLDEGGAGKLFIGQTFTYDTRDSRRDPHKGHLFSIGHEVAGLIGSTRYHKYEASAVKFIELSEKVVLSVLGKTGVMSGFGDSRVRIDDRYTFGGQGTIRGFRLGGVEARDARVSKKADETDHTGAKNPRHDPLGALQYYLGTVEISFPLGLPNELDIKGVVFGDIGAGWGHDKQETETLNSADPRISLGVGLAWNSPVGPLRVDYTRAIRKQDYDVEQQITLGYSVR